MKSILKEVFRNRTSGLKVREVLLWCRFFPPSSTATLISKALALLADDFTKQTVSPHPLFMRGEEPSLNSMVKVVKQIRGELRRKNFEGILWCRGGWQSCQSRRCKTARNLIPPGSKKVRIAVRLLVYLQLRTVETRSDCIPHLKQALCLKREAALNSNNSRELQSVWE